ncbi:helix-turn-helix domain-containing protein [Geodermatophilus sp. SYSU D01045]
MKQPDAGIEWAKRLTQVIADGIRAARGRVSAQKLADRCTELGYPIPRSTISNLESGRKETISVQELLVLARALEIPPLLLLFPLGRVDRVPLLPEVDAPTWPAARWFTGEFGFPTTLDDGRWEVVDRDHYAFINAVTHDFRSQEEVVEEWRRARQRGDGDQQRSEERSLQLIRRRIREQGLDPGELPAELAFVDAEG